MFLLIRSLYFKNTFKVLNGLGVVSQLGYGSDAILQIEPAYIKPPSFTCFFEMHL